MSTLAKKLFTIGTVLTLTGSFLPWEIQGDFFTNLTFGIRVYPSIVDNGGFLVVALSLIVIMLIFRPPEFIGKPLIWSIVFSLALVLDSVFHVGKLLIIHANAGGIMGAPEIDIGLEMVFIGSVILLIATILHYLKLSR
jgi:hypothetical protein